MLLRSAMYGFCIKNDMAVSATRSLTPRNLFIYITSFNICIASSASDDTVLLSLQYAQDCLQCSGCQNNIRSMIEQKFVLSSLLHLWLRAEKVILLSPPVMTLNRTDDAIPTLPKYLYAL